MTGICLLEFAVGAATHGEPMVGLLTVIVTLALSMFLVAKRLQNIGMSGWFALLGLVPVIGMIVGIRCLMMPEGYAQSHKLDATAKNILGVIIAFLVLVALLAAMAAFAN